MGFPRAGQENQEVRPLISTARSQPTAHSPGLRGKGADSARDPEITSSPYLSWGGICWLQFRTRECGGGHRLRPAQYLLKPAKGMSTPQGVFEGWPHSGYAAPEEQVSFGRVLSNLGPAGVEGPELPSNLRPKREPAPGGSPPRASREGKKYR